MAIDITDLFQKIGRVGKLALLVNTHQAALPAALEGLIGLYDGTTPPGLRDVVARVVSLAGTGAITSNQGAWLPVLQDAAQQTVLRTVRADRPSAAGTLGEALAEVVRQMRAGTETVKRSAVSVTPAAGTNQGDGVVVASALRGDGLANELLLPESARLECTADSFGGGRAAGAEGFAYFGQVGDPADVWAYDWPAGSGVAASYTAASPASGSLLLNGDFEDFAVANTPDSWAIEAGAAGTELFGSATAYDGAASLRWAGAATNTRISQAPTSALTALTAYAVALWVRVDVVPAAGVLTVDLTDSGGTVTQDAQAANNSFTRSLTTLTANTWTAVTGVFRTGKSVPSGVKLRLRLSTALSTGSNLFTDRCVLTPLLTPYAGGPGLAVVSGAAPFAAGDGWAVAAANDRGGASLNATFQALFDRLFGMRSLGLQLPSTAGSPTQPDTLITS